MSRWHLAIFRGYFDETPLFIMSFLEWHDVQAPFQAVRIGTLRWRRLLSSSRYTRAKETSMCKSVCKTKADSRTFRFSEHLLGKIVVYEREPVECCLSTSN